MKKKTTIDLTKFEEATKAVRKAQETVSCIQNQFYEMVLDEIEKNPVFECELIRVSSHEERYFSTLTVCNITVHLQFCVFENSDLSRSLLCVKLSCSPLDLSDLLVEPRKCLQIRLDVLEECTSTFLQYEAPGN